MKSKKKVLIPLLVLLLAGCDVNNGSNSELNSGGSEHPGISENSGGPGSSELPPSSDVPIEERNNYYLVDPSDNYPNRALDEVMDMTALNSLGDQKLLVVPITFTDTLDLATPAVHDSIRRTMFGESNETGWESVASFYAKSSYNKLNLSGEVIPYFHSQYSTEEFLALPSDINDQQIGEGFYWDQTHYLIEDIYNTLDAATLKEYDLDEDGHVDALWMVYIAPINRGTFWAYKFYWNREPNLDKPTPNVYAWASFQFMNGAYGYSSEKVDAHTFIHESGHIFGLTDYYDYDGERAPAGRVDMMDNNIIDHNAYSKYLLNWTSPYHVTGHADITLRPMEESGDFILIKDNWNGHAYDEYILLEYYTPTGLNERDSIYGPYADIGGMTVPGVRIWHVDSRLVQYKYKYMESLDRWVSDTINWSNEIIGDEATYTRIGPSNTGSRSVNGNGQTDAKLRLLHLLDSQGVTAATPKNWLTNPDAYANDTKGLFKEGQRVGADEWGKYFQHAKVDGVRPATFNDGSPVGYSVEIGEMTAEGVVIKVRKA